MLVKDSATVILAPAAAFISPFIGCSPMAVAIPSCIQNKTDCIDQKSYVKI